MKRFDRGSVLVVAAVFTVGCGEVVKATDAGVEPDDAGNGGVDARVDAMPIDPCMGPEIALEDFEECYFRAYCTYLTRCESSSYVDLAECLADSTGFSRLALIRVVLFQVRAAVEAGHVEVDGEALYQCLRGVQMGPCASDPDACDRFFIGLQGDGETCYEDWECGLGGECDEQSCGIGECCPGSCVAPVGVGAECAYPVSCETGLECYEGSCRDAVIGSECTGSYQCNPGLACFDGFCGPLHQAGGMCEEDAQCTGTLLCVGGECAEASSPGDMCDDECRGPHFCNPETLQCQALPGEDEDCSLSGSCQGLNLYCDPSGTCERLPGLGDGCLESYPRCGPGLLCEDEFDPEIVDPVCVAPLADDEPCDDSFQCMSFYCDPIEGVCADLVSCYE